MASFTTGGTRNVAQLQTTALYRLVTVGAHGGNWVWNKTTTYGGSGGSTTAVTPIDADATPNLYVVAPPPTSTSSAAGAASTPQT